MAYVAQTDAERVCALSTSRLRDSARLNEAELAAKSASLMAEADYVVRGRLSRHERGANEAQPKPHDEVVSLETRGRTQHIHLAHAASTDRGRSRDVDSSRVRDTFFARMRLGTVAAPKAGC